MLPEGIFDILNLPSSWFSSPTSILLDFIIPLFLLWYLCYLFLRRMGILGYSSGPYVILGFLISLVALCFLKIGRFITIFALGLIIILSRMSPLAKIICIVATIITYLIVIPAFLG